MPQLMLKNIEEIFPNFNTAHIAKNILRIINVIIASILHENVFGYLSLDIMCSS